MQAQSSLARLSSVLCLLVGLLLQPSPASAQGASTNRPHHLQYEKDIQAFEAVDKASPPPQNAILLIGSSSIRKWTNAPAQFPDHRLIMRGFGGSYLSDSVAFLNRIVIPYRPKLVLLYAGDNDIAGGKTPEQVFADFQEFVARTQAALPEARIAYLSIKPSPSRTRFMERFKTTNRLIQEFCQDNPKLIYVDVFTPMTTADGQPRPELFVSDRLHLNVEGYKLWAGIVKPVLEKVDSSPEADPGGKTK
jgi:lysophospholipase L1-like esterase